jgi:hypothetical protein
VTHLDGFKILAKIVDLTPAWHTSSTGKSNKLLAEAESIFNFHWECLKTKKESCRNTRPSLTHDVLNLR